MLSFLVIAYDHIVIQTFKKSVETNTNVVGKAVPKLLKQFLLFYTVDCFSAYNYIMNIRSVHLQNQTLKV